MEIEGKVIQLLPVQNISSQKGQMKKLGFIVETQAKFPRKIYFSLWNDKVEGFNSKTGDMVKVFFDLDSREYNDRWYTEAKAWKVENLSGTDDLNNLSAEKIEDVSFASQKDEPDDLPF